jgi:hypothetical protein
MATISARHALGRERLQRLQVALTVCHGDDLGAPRPAPLSGPHVIVGSHSVLTPAAAPCRVGQALAEVRITADREVARGRRELAGQGLDAGVTFRDLAALCARDERRLGAPRVQNSTRRHEKLLKCLTVRVDKGTMGAAARSSAQTTHDAVAPEGGAAAVAPR